MRSKMLRRIRGLSSAAYPVHHVFVLGFIAKGHKVSPKVVRRAGIRRSLPPPPERAAAETASDGAARNSLSVKCAQRAWLAPLSRHRGQPQLWYCWSWGRCRLPLCSSLLHGARGQRLLLAEIQWWSQRSKASRRKAGGGHIIPLRTTCLISFLSFRTRRSRTRQPERAAGCGP